MEYFSNPCSICRALFTEMETVIAEPKDARPGLVWVPQITKEQSYAHHQDFSSLKNSVNDKCYVCVRLWEEFYNETFGSSKSLDYRCAISAIPPSSPEYLPVAMNIWFHSEEPDNDPFPLRFQARASQEVSKLDPTYRNSRRRPFEQAKIWLLKCLKEHPSCSVNKACGLPTRLIHVENGNLGITARLCEGDSVSVGTEYLTLSHCWGRATFLTLTEQNIEQMRQSIPVNDLSRVFQDAMLTTMELGFSYLWIDSLCIIQNSLDSSDWLKESTTMDRVYGNSICNLSATSFHDGKEGYLPNGDLREIVPPEVDFSKLLRKSSIVNYNIISTFDWYRDILRSPLNHRAWVFQEQIMAPRVLHFTRSQVFWECSKEVCCEGLPHGSSRYFESTNTKALIKLTLTNSHGQQDEIYREWRVLLSLYSNTQITYPADKLPALSGVAKIFMRRLEDKYVAGLWEGDLHRSLLWETPSKISELSAYRAPSWSWASVDGSIFYPQSEMAVWHPVAQILETTVFPVTEDVTGQLTGGYLRMSSPLQKIVWQEPIRTMFGNFRWDNSIIGRVVGPSSSDEGSPKPIFISTILAKNDHNALISIDYSIPAIHMEQQMFLVPLIQVPSAEEDKFTTMGLVIYPVDGTKGTYRRVGTFMTLHSSVDQSIFSNDNTIEDSYYESLDELRLYTIRII